MTHVFSTQQRKILLGTVIAYTATYLNRLNLSAALGSVMDAFSISAASAGLLQTAFAIVYAAGQMINGAIVDRISPVRHMLISLIGAGLCNLLMGFAPNFGVFMALCMLNGAFQSMLWTPIVRLFALCFHTERQRGKANFIHSFAIIIGHLGAWAISGLLISAVGWQLSFIAPALVMVPTIIIVFHLLQSARKIGAAPSKALVGKKESFAVSSTLRTFAATGFGLILPACILYGFVRDGIITWAPEILHGLMGSSSLSATAFSLIIPLVNALGILLGYYLTRRGNRNIRKVVGYMNLACAAFCLLLPSGKGALSAALLMGFSCACLFGLSPLLTTMVPLEYDKIGRSALAAGLIDSFVYIGSALAGVINGRIYETEGTSVIYFTWAVSALIGAIAVYLSGTKRPIQAMKGLSIAKEGSYEHYVGSSH